MAGLPNGRQVRKKREKPLALCLRNPPTGGGGSIGHKAQGFSGKIDLVYLFSKFHQFLSFSISLMKYPKLGNYETRKLRNLIRKK